MSFNALRLRLLYMDKDKAERLLVTVYRLPVNNTGCYRLVSWKLFYWLVQKIHIWMGDIFSIVRMALDDGMCGKQWKKYRQYAQITDLKHRDVI